ncbi:MAG: hypothetical protein FK731_04305 [Asgard group archaeon]|nr:hypothetical protein [Asgard group archaeon]
MKVFVFLYDDFSDFEITQLLLLIRNNPVKTIGFDKNYVESIGQLKVLTDETIEEFNAKDADLFIIPGGEPKNFIKNVKYTNKIKILNQKLQQLFKNKKIIAAICGGPTFLANAGILDGINTTASISDEERIYYQNTNFTNSDLEIDGNIITAKGQAFTEFAIAVAIKCGCLEEKDAQEALAWFRNEK